jgi:hypothetical protein
VGWTKSARGNTKEMGRLTLELYASAAGADRDWIAESHLRGQEEAYGADWRLGRRGQDSRRACWPGFWRLLIVPS